MKNAEFREVQQSCHIVQGPAKSLRAANWAHLGDVEVGLFPQIKVATTFTALRDAL